MDELNLYHKIFKAELSKGIALYCSFVNFYS